MKYMCVCVYIYIYILKKRWNEPINTKKPNIFVYPVKLPTFSKEALYNFNDLVSYYVTVTLLLLFYL